VVTSLPSPPTNIFRVSFLLGGMTTLLILRLLMVLEMDGTPLVVVGGTITPLLLGAVSIFAVMAAVGVDPLVCRTFWVLVLLSLWFEIELLVGLVTVLSASFLFWVGNIDLVWVDDFSCILVRGWYLVVGVVYLDM